MSSSVIPFKKKIKIIKKLPTSNSITSESSSNISIPPSYLPTTSESFSNNNSFVPTDLPISTVPISPQLSFNNVIDIRNKIIDEFLKTTSDESLMKLEKTRSTFIRSIFMILYTQYSFKPIEFVNMKFIDDGKNSYIDLLSNTLHKKKYIRHDVFSEIIFSLSPDFCIFLQKWHPLVFQGKNSYNFVFPQISDFSKSMTNNNVSRFISYIFLIYSDFSVSVNDLNHLIESVSSTSYNDMFKLPLARQHQLTVHPSTIAINNFYKF